MKWSEREVENLRRLYAEYEGERVPVKDIAGILGKTEAAVRYKAHSLGLTDPSRPRAHKPSNGRVAQTYTKTCPVCGNEFTVGASRKDQECCGRSCATRKRMGGRYSRGMNRSRSGRRPDLDNRFFRSSWEANYARYLNFLMGQGQVFRWEFEPQIFYFPIKRGNTSYTPDFKVWVTEDQYEWHEIKGWMDENSRVKLKRFDKFYPEESERLVLIDKTQYSHIASQIGGLIPNWES